MTSPSMRRSGGAPAVMCMSLAPFSTIALRSWWRLTRFSAGWVIVIRDCTARLVAQSRNFESRQTHTCAAAGSVRHRHAEDLFGRGHAIEHLEDAGHAE